MTETRLPGPIGAMPTHSLTGILFAAGGVVTLCAMDAVAKRLGASMSTLEIVFVRYLGAALWLALYLWASRGAWPKRENLPRHLMRGGLMAITACFFFYGVTHLPLAVAAALAMSAPIYISIFGVVLLKERLSRWLLVAIGLGIVGSLVIVFGGEPVVTTGASDVLAWGAAILAPITYAAAIVLLKHHVSDESAASMILAQSLIAAMIALPFAAVGFAVPPTGVWAAIAIVGLLGAVGFLLLVAGLRRLPASVFAVVDYTGLIWAAIFGALFFAEVPGPELWIGGALIISACVVGGRGAGNPAT